MKPRITFSYYPAQNFWHAVTTYSRFWGRRRLYVPGNTMGESLDKILRYLEKSHQEDEVLRKKNREWVKNNPSGII